MGLIKPHGGELKIRLAPEAKRKALLDQAKGLPQLAVDERTVSDIEMFGIGGYSPLEGFVGIKDYASIVEKMHLANGLPWTIPITLRVSQEESKRLKEGKSIALKDSQGTLLALLEVQEVFSGNKENEAAKVYKTIDRSHPSVDFLFQSGDVIVAGPLQVLELPNQSEFPKNRLTPEQTRKIFSERGWQRVVGFQTRNPIHRAHEYIQKCAMEIVDGLFLHPLVGKTKDDDVPAEIRMKSYETIVEKYYRKERVVLGVLPAPMRYGGPREAILHAIMRKNYGCSHFIVGRDHAGVGKFYGSFDAQKIFDEFDPKILEITPLFFDYTFYCKACGNMASLKTCPHDPDQHVTLSGTKVREMLRAGELPPPEFSRAEVAQILIESMRVPSAKAS
ncbi:MAG: sulfate adenylyltransferase [Deltaproteobacteria bacterium]|nr:sulfate adenylyltransferase [Deltaproteobacteria bacterium]